ncbi:hypothetical protein [Bacillus atrophaeus]|uniref:hypothetical protein n=1 Tax=Bacillus atrophaeus TaxID=1452 RepID=UPI002E210C51|nr:hypothetical protein [Bacillus atrophaeus]
MNLVTILNSRNIAGIQDDTLKSILEGSHPDISVKIGANGMVMLSDNTIIKCTGEYYTNPNSNVDLKKHKNSVAKCHYVIEGLGVDGVDVNQCTRCHLRCMEKRKGGALKRIYK